LPTVDDYTERPIRTDEIAVAIDIGCGVYSALTWFRPRITTIGIDAHTVETAKQVCVHDHYIVADVIKLSAEHVLDRVLDRVAEATGARKVDLVTVYGVIEHLPKWEGWNLVQKREQLSQKYILLETPGGFVEQGPEFGNVFQRHLSGWFPHDFIGLGYDVYGTSGTKYMRGYMGGPRIRFPGAATFDLLVLRRLLRAHAHPRHAFNIVAVKDRRGVPARYESHSDPRRR
jgi:hypothetical protein